MRSTTTKEVKKVLWEWVQHTEGGVLPKKIFRQGERGNGIYFMTIFDPRRFRSGRP